MKSFSIFQQRDLRSCSRNNFSMAWAQAAILAISFHGSIAAEGPVAAVQKALKQQQFYGGESSGVLDEPTRNALRRFQIRYGLPATGEIDTGTLQALQNSADAARPAVQSLPSQTQTAARTAATVQKDRAFLEDLERVDRDRETASRAAESPASAAPPNVSNTAAVSEPVEVQPSSNVAIAPESSVSPPDSSAQSGSQAEPPRSTEVKKRPVAKPRSTITRRSESAPEMQNGESSPALEPVASGPRGGFETPRSAGRRRVVEEEIDPLEGSGVRILRPTTPSTGENNRSANYERKISSYSSTPAPVVRRAERVEPRRKEGFFDRLFKDDD